MWPAAYGKAYGLLNCREQGEGKGREHQEEEMKVREGEEKKRRD